MLTITDERAMTWVCVASIVTAVLVLALRTSLQRLVRRAQRLCVPPLVASAAHVVEYALLTLTVLARVLVCARSGVVVLSASLAMCTGALMAWSWRSAARLMVCAFVLYTCLLPWLLPLGVQFDLTARLPPVTHALEWASLYRGQAVQLPTFSRLANHGDGSNDAAARSQNIALLPDRVFVYHDHVHVTWPSHTPSRPSSSSSSRGARQPLRMLFVWSVGASTVLRGAPLPHDDDDDTLRRQQQQQQQQQGLAHDAYATRSEGVVYSSHVCLLGARAVVRDTTLYCAIPSPSSLSLHACVVAMHDAVFVNTTVVLFHRDMHDTSALLLLPRRVRIDAPVYCTTLAARTHAVLTSQHASYGGAIDNLVICLDSNGHMMTDMGSATTTTSTMAMTTTTVPPLLLYRHYCAVVPPMNPATTLERRRAMTVLHLMQRVAHRFAKRMPLLFSWTSTLPPDMQLRHIVPGLLAYSAHVGRVGSARARGGVACGVALVRHVSAGAWCALTTPTPTPPRTATRHARRVWPPACTPHPCWQSGRRGDTHTRDVDSHNVGVFVGRALRPWLLRARAATQCVADVAWRVLRVLWRLTPPLLQRVAVSAAGALRVGAVALVRSPRARRVWRRLLRDARVALRQLAVRGVPWACRVLVRAWRLYATTSLSTQLVVVALQTAALATVLHRDVRDALRCAAHARARGHNNNNNNNNDSNNNNNNSNSSITATVPSSSSSKAAKSSTHRNNAASESSSTSTTTTTTRHRQRRREGSARGAVTSRGDAAGSDANASTAQKAAACARWSPLSWWRQRAHAGRRRGGVWPAAVSRALTRPLQHAWLASSLAARWRAARSLRTQHSLSVHYLVVHGTLLLTLVGLSVLPGATRLYRVVLLCVLPWCSSRALLAFATADASPPSPPHAPRSRHVLLLCGVKAVVATLFEHTIGTLVRSVVRDAAVSLSVFAVACALLYAWSRTHTAT